MCGTNPYQHVDVIGSSVNDERVPIHPAHNASEIRKQNIAEIRLDQRASTLRRKNDMQQNIAQAVRHRIFRPFGLADGWLVGPRLAAWAELLRRFAAAVQCSS